MKIRLIAIGILAALSCAAQALAGPSSASFSIPSSVLGGGGGAMSSANYQMNSTLGQSSPLMDPADPPYSDAYDLYPGFWYTMGVAGCLYDLDGDGDVDGQDLAEFAEKLGTEFEPGDLGFLAEEFGRVGCPIP